MATRAEHELWRATRRLTAWLVAAWLVLVVVPPWFARDLESLQWLGFPLGFWLVGQGTLLGFLAVVAIYVRTMARLETAYAGGDEGAEGSGAAAPAPARAERD